MTVTDVARRRDLARRRQARKRAHDRGDHSTCETGSCPGVTHAETRDTPSTDGVARLWPEAGAPAELSAILLAAQLADEEAFGPFQ